MLEPMVMQSGSGREVMTLLMEYLQGDFVAHLVQLVVGLGMVSGALFMLLAAVGTLRLPDLPTRMHASTKAGTLGAALIMLAVAFHMPETVVWARAFAVVAFLILTAPVAAHVIGRAGYYVGVPLWSGTVKDELADQYDFDTHTLSSGGFAHRQVPGYTETDDEILEEPEEEDTGPISRRFSYPEDDFLDEEGKVLDPEERAELAEEAKEAKAAEEAKEAEQAKEAEEAKEAKAAEEAEESEESEESEETEKKTKDSPVGV